MINERTLKAIKGALFVRGQSLTEEAMLAANAEAMHLVNALLNGDAIASLWSIEESI